MSATSMCAMASGVDRIRNFFLDQDPKLFVPAPDQARMKEHINKNFISNLKILDCGLQIKVSIRL